MSTAPELSVVVPCYNEAPIIEASAGRLLETLPVVEPAFEIVFCDDGSTDDTRDRLRTLARRHPEIRVEGYSVNKGAGHAFRTAARAARGRLIVHMDADLAVDPIEAARACLDSLATHDLVFCSRYQGVRARYPLRRRLPSLAYRAIYRTLLRVPVRDAMSGFFGLRRKVLDAIPPLESDGFEVYLELLVKAHRQGLRVAEVPVAFTHRTESGEVSVLRHGPRQLVGTLRVWWRFVLASER